MIKVKILSGVSGCGKSSYISSLNGDYSVCSTDSFIQEYAKHLKMTYAQAYQDIQKNGMFSHATKKFYNDIESCITNGIDFVVDRTNLSSEGRKSLIQNLRLVANNLNKELYIETVYFDTDPKLIKQRLIQREKETGKHIPDDVIHTQFNTFEPVKPEEGHDNLVIINEKAV